MELYEKIRLLRKNLGLTLEEVGDYVGVGKSTVRKWESGIIANMRRDKIAKLAEVLHTTPAYLMGWPEEPAPVVSPDPVAPELLEGLQLYEALDLEDRAEIRGRMKQLLEAPKYSKNKESKNA